MAFTSAISPCDNAPVNGHVNPHYGSRLLPQVVDELARTNPKRIYATLPLSSDLAQGFLDVTMLQVSQAVNKCAYWLEHTIGRSSSFETLSYIGLPDVRYAIIFLAAVKCGYKLLVPSVRNSTWMNTSLLEQTRCTKFLYATEFSDKVQDLQTHKMDLQIFVVQSLSDMLQKYTNHYPYEVEFSDVQWDPVLILHSSGSTGPPKPIQTNHATWAVADNDRNLPTVKGRKNQSYALWNFEGDGGRYFAAFPPSHLGGFMALIVLPIFSTTATLVLPPVDRPPTGHLASEIMKHYEIRALFCPPTIFEQLVIEPEGLEQAKRLDFLLYAGGPLSTTTGNLLSQVTDVCQFYGSTETGAVPALVPLREDWASLEWHPSYRADMQPCEDEAYEMVLHKDPQLEGVRSLSCNFPDVEQWHTRDLFRPHPTKPNLWQFHGRTDDIIVLSNGEKFNPSPSEAIIAGHHLLSGAIVVGLARFQPALLVELRDGVDLRPDAVIEEIWPTVQQANAQAPGHARVIRSMIAVAATKRFERAGKGTVIRKMTAEKFEPEIESLYSEDNLGDRGRGPVLTGPNDLGAIQDYVRASINLSFPVPDFEEDEDLYALGLDSLKTVEIMGILRAGIVETGSEASSVSWLSTQVLYANPTIRKLSEFIFKSLSPLVSGEEHHVRGETRITQMATLVHKYTEDLPQIPSKKNQLLETSRLNVVLTGSTGSLGTHLLRSLLDDPTITKIYCLNRSNNSRERQEEIFKKLGFKQSLSRAEFIKANYEENQLGLSDAHFNELATTVDIIIHNAWKVDFNHSLESFQPVHIQGVRKLIDWSIHSPRHPHIIFLSSTSSVGNWERVHRDEPVSETPISSHHVAQEMGYGESKHVAECILNVASEKSGVQVSVLRIGQIAGPVSAPGVWNRDEWFPSLIKTSQSLGYLPSYVPDANWIPVDSLAATIVDIVHFAATTDQTCTYNIVNPHSTAWTLLLDTVRKRLDPQIQVIELSDWIQMLGQIDRNDAQNLTDKPAAKILDFYRALEAQREMAGGLRFSTAHSMNASKTMARLEPVNKEWMDVWLTQWGYSRPTSCLSIRQPR